MSEAEPRPEPDPEAHPDRWPLVEGSGSDPVPDLAQVPRDRWLDTLRSASPRARRVAANTVALPDVPVVMQLCGRLEVEDPGQPIAGAELSARIAWPTPLPSPTVPLERRRNRAVTFRLSPMGYDDLARAAELIDAAPTTLARLLVVRGVRGLLREDERPAGATGSSAG